MTFQGEHALARGKAPQLGRPVIGSGRKLRAVRREADCIHQAPMPLQRQQAIACGHAPQLRRVVVVVAGGGDVERREHDERESGALAG
eukprot:10571796-Alexandrium_andersonii.AAC.1